MKVKVQWVALLMAVLVVALPARAVVLVSIWSATPTDGTFGTPTNWDVVPGLGAAVVFTASTQANVSLAAAANLNSITFDNRGGAFPAYTFSTGNGSALTLGVGGITAATGGATSVTFDSSLPITLGSAQTWDVGNAVYLNVNSVVSGANALTKTGGGSLVLAGANTFSGGTTIAGGYISIATDGALGAVPASPTTNLTFAGGNLSTSATLTLNANRNVTFSSDAHFDIANGTTLTIAGVASGAGGIVMNPLGGTIDLTGNNTFGGTVTIIGGTLRASHANALGTTAGGVAVSGGASLEINNVAIGAEPVSVGGVGASATGALLGTGTASLSGPVTLTADTSIGGTGNLTLSGGIGQAGGTWSLTKDGTGLLALPGTSTYGGATMIKAGTLQLGANNSLPSTTTVTVAPALASTTATFDLNGKNQTIAGLTLGWASNSTANVSVGTGTLTLAGNLTFDGSSSPSASLISGTGSIDLGAVARTFNIGDSASVSGPELSIVPALIGSGASVNKTGAGLLEFQGANTYTGGTTISAGGLVARNASGSATGTGNITINSGAYLQIGVGSTTGSVSGGITDNGGITFNRSDTISYTGISGSGTVTQTGAGTLTLTGTNSYTGSTTLNAGTLADGAANGFSPSSRIVFNAASTSLSVGFNDTVAGLSGTGTNGAISIVSGATLSVANGGNESFGGVISGAGSLTKSSGAGTQTLTGANTFTGGVTINAGQIAVNSDGNLGATSGGLTLNNGVLITNSSFTLASARAVSVGASGGGLSQATGTTLTFGGVISGAGTFTKYDNGTLILSGANTYTGATSIIAGTLSAANVSALGTTAGGTTVALGTTLDINNVVIGAEPVSLNGSGVGGNGALTGTGNASLSGAVTLAGTSNIGGTGTLSLLGNIGESATSRLTKVGSGTLILNGTNSYSGGTTINGGTLSIASDAALGAVPGTATPGSITINNGARLNATSDFTIGANRGISIGGGSQIGITSDMLGYNGIIAGGGGLQKVGGGVLQLGGANIYTGGTQVLDGAIQLSGSGALPSGTDVLIKATGASIASLDLNGRTQTIGSLTFGGSGSVAGAMTSVLLGADGTLTLGGDVFYDPTNNPLDSHIYGGTLNLGAATRTFQVFDSTNTAGELSVSSLISGAGGLTKTGVGTLTLTSTTSTYTGPTWVKDGTLEVYSLANLSAASSLGAPTTAVDGTIKLGDANTTGTLRYVGSGAVTTNRAIDLAGTLGGAKIINDGSDLLTLTGAFSASGAGSKTLTLGGSMTGKFGGAIVDNSATNKTSLAKIGSNTWILTGDSTYTGFTNLNGGTLQIGDGGTTGSILGSVNSTGETTLAFNRSDALTYAGSLSGTGGLEQMGAGVLTLTGNHSYTGGTSIDEGATLSIGAGGTTGSLPFNDYTYNYGTLIFNRSDNTSFGGQIYGDGNLVKKGTNSLSLTNFSGWIGGSVTVEGGTLAMGTLSGDGDLILGTGTASATLRFIGNNSEYSERNITLGTTGGVTIDVFGTGSLNLSGAVSATAGSKTLTLKGDNNNADNSINGGISDPVTSGTTSLIKAGFGQWTLGGTNTYTGGTVINNGTLYLGNNALPTGGAVTINATSASRATLSLFDGSSQSNAIGALTFGGAGASPFSNNMLLLDYSGTFALGGDITYIATNGPGPAFIARADPFSDSSPGGTLVIGSGNRIISVADSNTAGQDLVITANLSGNSDATITKTGAGALLLGGNSTYGGGTIVSAGTLLLGTSSYNGEGSWGPVGFGPLTMQAGTRLAAATVAFGNGGGGGDNNSIQITNQVNLASNVTLGGAPDGNDHELELAGPVTVTAATATLHLGSQEPILFSGALGGSTTTLIFDNGGQDGRGVSIFTGPVGSTLSSITFDGAAGIFGSTETIASGVQLKVVNNGYLGIGATGAEGLAPIPALLSHIASADRATFNGTLGFDTGPHDYIPYIFNVAGVDFSGFGSNFRIGSLSAAILQGAFTPPATGYTFGGGGGALIVRSQLTGAQGVTVNSPTTIDQNALLVVLQSAMDNENVVLPHTYTGGLSVTNSLAILDSPTALPATSGTIATAGKFTLGDNAYLGYTEQFTTATSFADFVARMSSHTAKSIIGFDSTDYIAGLTSGGGTYGDFRYVIEKIDLSGLTAIALGTATAAILEGEILAPNQGGANRTLNLVAPGGVLFVSSPLLQGKVNSVVIGSSDFVLENGTVGLFGQNTYSAGTTLLSGTVLVGDSSKLANDGSIAVGPLGRGTVTVPANATGPILLPYSGDTTVLHNPFSLGSTLQIGATDLGNLLDGVTGAYGILNEGWGSSGRLVLNGVISNQGSNVGGLEIYTDTQLNGANTFTGNVNLHYGELTIGHDSALGVGNALNIMPFSNDNEPYVALAVANGSRTIANAVNLNLFPDQSLEINGPGSLTITGPVQLNSGVTFETGSYPLFLNGGVTGNGRLTLDGDSAVVLGGAATYSGGTRADYGAIIFGGATNTLPTGGLLSAGYYGYIGLSSTDPTVISSYLNKFDRGSTDGSIGFDTLGSGTNTYSLAINFGGGNAFDSNVRLGSATQAILTGVITPQSDTYRFGGGGGLLTVQSALGDFFNGETTDSRSVQVESNSSHPTTVRLAGGSKTFTGGVSVYNSGVIFDATSMPTSGSFYASSGYVGTETANASLPVATYFGRFNGETNNSIIGFDTTNSASPYVLNEALTMPGLGGNIYLGTATAANISSNISLGGLSAYRFAGYKGGQLTVSSTLTDGGKNASVVIGDRNNIGTAGSPNNPNGALSSVTLTGANTYLGGTTLQAGKLLLGNAGALGSGTLWIEGNSTYYNPDTSPLATPVLGVVQSGLVIPNNIYLYSDLRVAVGTDGGLGSSSTLELAGTLSSGGSYGSLIKAGPGQLLLSGTNNLDHDIFVEQGNLTFKTLQSIGVGSVRLGDLSPSVTFGVDIAVNGISSSNGSGVLNVGAGKTLTINQTSDSQYLGTFTGSGSTLAFSNSSGSSTTVFLGGNSSGFNGTTNIGGSVTVVAGSAGAFGPSGNTVNLAGGTLALGNGVIISNNLSFLTGGGTLAGGGTLRPTSLSVTIGSGAHLAPGFSPGTLTLDGSSLAGGTATLVLASGGSYQWQVFDATPALAQWDRIVVTNGTVNIAATSVAPFNFQIELSDPNMGLLGFDMNQNYAWTVLTAPTISGFAANKFNLGIDDFFTGLEGHFGLIMATDAITGNQSLLLNFTAVPEPSTYGMIALGLGAVVLTLRRRRNS